MTSAVASYTTRAIQKLQKPGIMPAPEADTPGLVLLDAIVEPLTFIVVDRIGE